MVVPLPAAIRFFRLPFITDGLFCEKIFGPSKDWECHCGKYKKIRFKGKVCERCGVEVTRAKVRRERMGHIELAAPVSHIWYFKGTPSRIGQMLEISQKRLEEVLYFTKYIVIDPGNTELIKGQLLTEKDYSEMQEKYDEDEFRAGMGAEAIKELLEEEGKQMPELEFVFRFDIGSFFDYYSYLNMSGVAKKAGVNASLMRQYAMGKHEPSQKRKQQILDCLRQISQEMQTAVI
jgi:DNA-directed RNA polymerase beta' subunit